MIASYKRKSNIAACVIVFGFLADILLVALDRPKRVTGAKRRPFALKMIAFAIAIGAVLSACSNKLSMSDCEKDADCARAYEMVVSANQTVANVCPKNSSETSPACESAMSTLNTAEVAIFPRLQEDDAKLKCSLMLTR